MCYVLTMKDLFTLLAALTFITYGILCLVTNHMKNEFERYGMSKYRKLTGVLELLGGIGLIVGFKFNLILIIASAGLGSLMFLGSLARIRVRDSIVEILPALSLMILNFYLLYEAIY